MNGLLEEILAAIDNHVNDYPGHGINCACMDDHIRRLRMALVDRQGQTIERAAYVMACAAHSALRA